MGIMKKIRKARREARAEIKAAKTRAKAEVKAADKAKHRQQKLLAKQEKALIKSCLLYTSPSPRDRQKSRMPSSA